MKKINKGKMKEHLFKARRVFRGNVPDMLVLCVCVQICWVGLGESV